MSGRSFRWRDTVVAVDAVRDGDEILLRRDDGEQLTFRVSRVGSYEWVLRDPRGWGRAHTVFAVRDGSTCWIHVDGRTWVLEAVVRRREAAAGDLVAPTPATVTEVLVAAGDQVEEGEVLMVLSAMKMQMEIKAPRAGEVEAVHYGTGDSVDGGATLAELRTEASGDG